MKQILSFSEEYLDLRAVRTIPEGKDPTAEFKNYVIERAMDLLYIDREEAEAIIDGGDDYLHYNDHGDGYADASVYNSGGYTEFLRLDDVPPAAPAGTGNS